MTPQEIKQFYQDIRNTLNTVEVRGVENMNHLLGCIFAMDNLWPEISKQLAVSEPPAEPPEVTLEEPTDA